MVEDPVIENPSDGMPPGKPLKHDEIASEDGDDRAPTDRPASEAVEPAEAPEFEAADNDLVNVGKFTDPEAES